MLQDVALWAHWITWWFVLLLDYLCVDLLHSFKQRLHLLRTKLLVETETGWHKNVVGFGDAHDVCVEEGFVVIEDQFEEDELFLGN